MRGDEQMRRRIAQCRHLLELDGLTEREFAQIAAYVLGRTSNLFFRCNFSNSASLLSTLVGTIEPKAKNADTR